jgi:hypothetical protein
MAQTKNINAILLLYHHPVATNAPTIMEHVNSFRCHSQFRVWTVNTALGFPTTIERLRFRVILLHYSLFGVELYSLSDSFLRYLEQHEASYKIAFFQDEHQYCQKRFAFLNRFHIDCVYTLLAPAYFQDVYQKYTNVPKLVTTLTGYVSDDLIEKARKFAKPDYNRKVDVGYRTRQLPFWMGRGSQEKHEIGVRFHQYAQGAGLRMDIETDEGHRLYGDKWYRFLGDCKACLGVEAGVSIFDTEDIVYTEYKRLIAKNPEMTFEEMSERLLNRWEGNIPYRTISPRHFEAAAFRICQILYEGDYQGIMKPMVHYIPLKKDFSNFDEVIRLFRDDNFRHQITDNCYRDLIASGRYSYRKFIKSFDQELLKAGLAPQITRGEEMMMAAVLSRDKLRRWLVCLCRATLHFFGRPIVKKIYSRIPPLVRIYRRVIQWLEK